MTDNKLSVEEILKQFDDFESLCSENVIGRSEDENEMILSFCLKK